MLRISKLADYAILIMNDILAQQQLLSASEIARHTALPEPTVCKILKILTKKQLLNSKRGANGGYQLAQTAEKISLADIIAAVDGDIALTECTQVGGHCEWQKNCSAAENWQYISRSIHNGLAAISLRDMQKPLTETQIQFHFIRKT